MTRLGRPPQRPWRAAALAGFILASASVALALVTGVPAEEDAFIYYRYALHAAQGYGLTFNPGDPAVEGFSSPLWMAVLATLAGAGAIPHVAARLASLLLVPCVLVSTLWLGRSCGLRPVWRWAAAASLLLNFWFLVWSQAGLETNLYSLALAGAGAAVVRWWSDARPRAEMLAGAWCALVALSRPEGLVLGFFLGLAVYSRAKNWKVLPRRFLLTFLLPVVLYEILRRLYFGAWLPNTSVKLYTLHVDRSLPQAASFVLQLGVLLVCLAAMQALRGRPTGLEQPPIRWVARAGLLVGFGFHFLAGGDYRPGFRYLLPALPFLLVAGFGLVQEFMNGKARILRGASLVLLLFSTWLGSAIEWRRNPWTAVSAKQISQAWRMPFTATSEVDAWILNNVPTGSSVAYGQMGRTPYVAALRGHPVRFIDTVGWVSREIAAVYSFPDKLTVVWQAVRGGAGLRTALFTARRERAQRFVDVLLEMQPRFILIEAHLQHAGMDALAADERFRARYQLTREFGGTVPTRAYRLITL